MESPNDSFSPLSKPDIPYIDGEMENTNASADESDPPAKATNGGSRSPGGLLSLFGRYTFPFLLTRSVVQLSIYLNKLYQDSAAVGKYYSERDLHYCGVSTLCLFLPCLVYIVYVVAAYVKEQEETEPKEVGTKVVHGLLLVPWQIKGRVEVLQFSAQRVCQRRVLTQSELEEKSILERQAAVLEFFEEFYAGLTQLLLQLYIIIISLDEQTEYKALTGELIASGLTLVSMMAAVRRRDDGPLTGVLSLVGWLSILISRALAIALATTVIHGWMLLACALHALLVSLWVTSIALATHQPSSSLGKRRRTALFCLVLAVFGLPSLTYWPIMFELKKHKRPLLFLLLLLLENALCLGVWKWGRRSEWATHDYHLLVLACGSFVLGALFILFYICCKPKYTDSVVYHDMKASNADSFGMYFEFCDVAFRLERKKDVEERLREVRAARAS